MNENNANTRTLILSFAIAVMALVPLRFVEVGQMLGEQPMVLGETTAREEVVLPKQATERPLLEQPYDEIEAGATVLGESVEEPTACIAVVDADQLESKIIKRMQSEDVTRGEIDELVAQMAEIENLRCK